MNRRSALPLATVALLASLSGCTHWQHWTTGRTPADDGFVPVPIFSKHSGTNESKTPAKSSTTSAITQVWDTSKPPQSAITPAGFTIAPDEAYAIALRERRISQKHVAHVYADKANYYVVNAMFCSNGKQARKHEVVVVGATGEIRSRE